MNDDDDDEEETKLKHNSIVTTIDTGIPCNGPLFNLINELNWKIIHNSLILLSSSLSIQFVFFIQFIYRQYEFIYNIFVTLPGHSDAISSVWQTNEKGTNVKKDH